MFAGMLVNRQSSGVSNPLRYEYQKSTVAKVLLFKSWETKSVFSVSLHYSFVDLKFGVFNLQFIFAPKEFP